VRKGGSGTGNGWWWSSCRSEMDLWLHHAATFPGLLTLHLARNVALSINAGGIFESLWHHRFSTSQSVMVLLLLFTLSVSMHDLLPSLASVHP